MSSRSSSSPSYDDTLDLILAGLCRDGNHPVDDLYVQGSSTVSQHAGISFSEPALSSLNESDVLPNWGDDVVGLPSGSIASKIPRCYVEVGLTQDENEREGHNRIHDIAGVYMHDCGWRRSPPVPPDVEDTNAGLPNGELADIMQYMFEHAAEIDINMEAQRDTEAPAYTEVEVEREPAGGPQRHAMQPTENAAIPPDFAGFDGLATLLATPVPAQEEPGAEESSSLASSSASSPSLAPPPPTTSREPIFVGTENLPICPLCGQEVLVYSYAVKALLPDEVPEEHKCNESAWETHFGNCHHTELCALPGCTHKPFYVSTRLKWPCKGRCPDTHCARRCGARSPNQLFAVGIVGRWWLRNHIVAKWRCPVCPVGEAPKTWSRYECQKHIKKAHGQ